MEEKIKEEAGGGGAVVHTVPFRKLFAFADPTDAVLMVAGTLGAAANGAAMPLSTVILGNAIDSFGAATSGDVVDRVSKVCLQFTYLAVGCGIACFFQVGCWMITGERQAGRIRSLYLETILKQEIAFFDMETSTGEVVGRISGDTVLIQDAMGEKVGKFIQLTSTFFWGFAIAISKGWLLTVVMLCTIPLLVAAGAAMATVISNMAAKGQTAYAEAAVVVDQAIGSIKTVASFTGERLSIEKYNKSLEKAYNSSAYEGFATGIGLGTVQLVMFAGYSLGVWYGAKLILDRGDYSGGVVVNVIFSVLIGSMSFGQATPCITAFAVGKAAAYKMFETIHRKPQIDASSPTGKRLDDDDDDIRGDIEFRDVHFSYPTRPDEHIFEGFSLLIESGKTVALVGQSGSGKSTVISLIERFYDPRAGEVLIDGINLKEFQLGWIRERIGLVSQEPVLFTSSIRDNIVYGKGHATEEEIRTAVKLANASKFIDKMPQGLDTMIGEHGSALSGGQKQRIAIARTILKDPRILLLDEATSALDAESERVVQNALDRVKKSRTTVVVAHRLNTVRDADTIAVIHQGSILEKGSHSELLKLTNGAYCQLIRLQEANQNPSLTSSQGNENELPEDLSNVIGRSSSRYMSLGRSKRCRSSKRSFSVEPPLALPKSSSSSSLKPASTETPEVEQAMEEEVSVWRLAYLNKPEIPLLVLGSISAIFNGLVYPAFGFLLSTAIKTFNEPPAKMKEDARFWSLMYLSFGVVSLLATPATSHFFGKAGSKLIKRIRLMTFEKVVHMEVGWFDRPENTSGAIGARLSADAAAVRSLVGDSLALIVQNATTVVASLVVAFTSNWQLSLLVLALLPLVGINGWVQMKFLQGFSSDAKTMYEDATQVANDAVGNIRTVASFSAEGKVVELYKKRCEGPTRAGIRLGVISGIGFGISFFLLFGVHAASFYVGARLVQDGNTTFDKVFRVFFVLSTAAVGVSKSSSLAPDSSKAQSATASVFALLDRKSEIDSSDDSGMTVGRLEGKIELQHVRFRYPTRPDVQIFQDLCLDIDSGKTVALVGESGCGKSTVISLLQRFYNPDSGQILLDGVEIQKFQLRWLRQQMGLVSQEPNLFNDTIRANIAYGKEVSATETEISEAAELANASNFISGLQQGYETMVGERGIQLSGGQKQRVAIARAILKDPRILLLDEATSALDAESERVVQDALDRVMVNRTTVIVAHQLSTIRGANLIAVVKNGVIVEKGNHERLMEMNGAYASLVSLHSSA